MSIAARIAELLRTAGEHLPMASLRPSITTFSSGTREEVVQLFVDGELVATMNHELIAEMKRPGERIKFQWGRFWGRR